MTKYLSVLFFALLAFSAQATEPTSTGEKYTADLTASTVAWKGYKVTGQHSGVVSLKDASLMFDEGQLTGGEFQIDMTSLKATDGAGDKLNGHLKSDDFFGVEKHPTASFKITKVVPRGTGGSYKVIGDLTIKGITKEIKFNADVMEDSAGKSAKANIQIDRSEFNVKYGSGSFFDNLGDKAIYDEFDLEVSLKLKKA